ncbi:MAG: ECF transporter S component [Clostridia bacterium]|nr:ECF transporter S component [Clostridia bacterium]
MIQVIARARNTVKGRILLTVAAIVGAVALPQLVHVAGRASGVGTALGELLLPMHFFVLLAGLLAGPAVGLVTGACAPIISCLLSGMPKVAVLPFMTIELIGYGLAAGLLSKSKLSSFLKLLVAQVFGRFLRALAVFVAVGLFDVSGMSVTSVWNAVVAGLLGILLQWCILPLILFCVNASEEI